MSTGGRLFDCAKYGRAIRVRIAELGIDQATAARQMGVPKSSLHRFCKGRGPPPNLENYLRIERWLKETEEPAP